MRSAVPKSGRKLAYTADRMALSGVAWERKHDDKNAIDAWNKALETRTRLSENACEPGLVYARRGEYDRAAAELRKAIESDPDEADAHYNLALVLAEQGHTRISAAGTRRGSQHQPRQ